MSRLACHLQWLKRPLLKPFSVCLLFSVSSLALASCQKRYRGGIVKDPRGSFQAPNCDIQVESGQPASDSQFYLVNGRRSFAFLVLDRHYQGEELETYWKAPNGTHHFVTTRKQRTLHYSFPDDRSAKGALEMYRGKRDRVAVKEQDGSYSFPVKPTTSCELVPQAVEPSRVENRPDIAVQPRTAPLCVPGSTQACVGVAACSGGQSCLPDGSGFSPCDCGPKAGYASQPSDETPELEAGEKMKASAPNENTDLPAQATQP